MGHREILDSWKEIADYLNRDARTCQRYERELGLPIHRLDGSAKARVFAYTDEIDAWLQEKVHERDGAARPSPFSIRSKPFILTVLIISLAALGAFIVWRLSPGGHSLRPSERPSIAVLPLENVAGEASLDDWREGIPQILIEGLSRSKFFDVLSDARVYSILRDLNLNSAQKYSAADLEAIAKRGKATHAVTGSVMRAGKSFIFILIVQRPGSEEIHPSRYECADESAVVKTIDRMVTQIKMDLGLSRSQMAGDHDATQIEVSTTSFEAFRLYNEGRRLHLAADHEQSVLIMRQALALDPKFALAWRSLAASLGNLEAIAEADECLRKALDYSQNASIKERLYIKADYFFFMAEHGKALETCREWISLFPEDTQALMFTGREYLYMEDVENARKALAESLRKGDTNPYTFFYSALANAAAGKFDEAEQVCERGLSIHPDNKVIVWASIVNAISQGYYEMALWEAQRHKAASPDLSFDLLAGDILLLKGDFAGAEKEYQGSGQMPPFVLTRLASLALAEGRYERAANLAEKAKNHLLLAYIEARRGRLTAGLAEAGRALYVDKERGFFRTVLEALQLKGMIEAVQGNLAAARETVSRLQESPPSGLQRAQERSERFLEGLIESAAARPGRAIEEFEAAVALLPKDIPYLDNRPDSPGFGMHALFLFCAAEEHERTGDAPGAAELYKRILGLHGGRLKYPELFALSHFALGRIAETRGDTAGARQSYGTFLELWKNADVGQQKVVEARARLDSLN